MENLRSQESFLRRVPRNVSTSVYINNNGVLGPSNLVHLSNIDYDYYMNDLDLDPTFREQQPPIQRFLLYDHNTNKVMWYKLQDGVYVNCLNDGIPWNVAVNVVNTEQLNTNHTYQITPITPITRQKYLKYKNKYINLKKSAF
jgi:hypothetical protein